MNWYRALQRSNFALLSSSATEHTALQKTIFSYGRQHLICDRLRRVTR